MAKTGYYDLSARLEEVISDDLAQLTMHSAFRRIPVEIWENVFANLDVDDITNIRLCKRQWAAIAARYLFPKFVLRVDRKDFERFGLVARSADMTSGVKRIIFDLGILSLEASMLYVGTQYQDDYTRLSKSDAGHEHTSEAIENKMSNAVQEYALWNSNWHDAKQNYRDLVQMSSLFRNLSGLERIDITYKNCSLHNPYLIQCWKNRLYYLDSKKITDELATILSSLHGNDMVKLKEFTHDLLPVTFFGMDKHFTNPYSPLSNLTVLRLNIYAKWCPPARFWVGLAELLKAAPSLEELCFGFSPLGERLFSHPGQWYNGRDPRGWYLPWWKFLGDFTWKRLKTLRLNGLLLCEAGLSEFLERHAATLRSLELFNIGLWQGSFQSLLSGLRISLKLTHFKAWGILRAVHHVQDTWYILPEIELSAEVWSQQFLESVKQGYAKVVAARADRGELTSNGVGAFLQGFVQNSIGGFEWILNGAHTLTALLPSINHNDKCAEDCSHAPEEISAAWDDRVRKPLTMWDEHIDLKDHPYPNIGEERILDIYLYEGRDLWGYDSKGLDENGNHFSTENTGGHAIGQTTALTIVRTALLRNIPRYNQGGQTVSQSFISRGYLCNKPMTD